jgi:hypothetical protein
MPNESAAGTRITNGGMEETIAGKRNTTGKIITENAQTDNKAANRLSAFWV